MAIDAQDLDRTRSPIVDIDVISFLAMAVRAPYGREVGAWRDARLSRSMLNHVRFRLRQSGCRKPPSRGPTLWLALRDARAETLYDSPPVALTAVREQVAERLRLAGA
jgi:hypothetical protein